MDSENQWLHGTEVYFENWKLSLGKLAHKNGLDAHSAIFFTSSKEFASTGSNGSGGICTARLVDGANILDMNCCDYEESNKFRLQVSQKKICRKNMQIQHFDLWSQGWKTGNIMKYAPSSQHELERLQAKLRLSMRARHTPEGAAAFNEIQILTRGVIEELVQSARELGYDAVIGNEIDTLDSRGPQTYPIMFALTSKVLTDPTWITKPKA